MDELIRKWEKTGLLEYLNSDELKCTLATKFEELAHYLIEYTGEYDFEEMVTTVSFPIVRRVYSQGKRIDNIPSFVHELNDYWTSGYVRGMIMEHHGVNGIDMEAELTAEFADKYGVDKIKPKQWVTKHKL